MWMLKKVLEPSSTCGFYFLEKMVKILFSYTTVQAKLKKFNVMIERMFFDEFVIIDAAAVWPS